MIESDAAAKYACVLVFIRGHKLNTFESLDSLLTCFNNLGATKIFCKFLAENDNSKQQIYLGNSFEVLRQLVFGEITSFPDLKQPNFKASVPLLWVNATGSAQPAQRTQLILYPKYPEIRLSGFLIGCDLAPSALLQPIQRDQRKFNNGPDGRVLFLAVNAFSVFAYLAAAGSNVAKQLNVQPQRIAEKTEGALREIIRGDFSNPRELLLVKLRALYAAGWRPSVKLDKHGQEKPYTARNGGGYTLEAFFGITPNGRSEPDFHGWELKTFAKDRITLMTPEPDCGFYRENGVSAFVRKYGHSRPIDDLYFTGTHRVGALCLTSNQTLVLAGFDEVRGKITDIAGGIHLIDSTGALSAGWTFAGLIDQWCRKHAAAAYIQYESAKGSPNSYRYKSPVILGEESDFPMFLSALASGNIIYDPASKLAGVSTAKPKSKARSQFRISAKKLGLLYKKIEKISIEK